MDNENDQGPGRTAIERAKNQEMNIINEGCDKDQELDAPISLNLYYKNKEISNGTARQQM